MKEVSCTECGALFIGSKPQRTSYRKGNNVYCGPSCLAAKSSRTMTSTNLVHASDRMRSNNPMSNPKALRKMKATLHRIGHKPTVQGGNGKGMTVPEAMLSVATGLVPYTVSTHMKRSTGYPTHYKLDLADPKRMLGIEIDGSSHTALSRRAQDRKKEAFLKGLGWTIIRFTNKQVLEGLQTCVTAIGG